MLQAVNGQPLTTPATPTQDPKTPSGPPAPFHVVTAFIVFQLPNGQWISADDLNLPVIPDRKPVPDDLIAGTENVKAQVIGRLTGRMSGQATIEAQLGMIAQAQQQVLSPEEAAAISAAQRH